MCLFTDKTMDFLEKSNCVSIRANQKQICLEGREWWGYSLPNGNGWMKTEGLGSFERAFDWLKEPPESLTCPHGYMIWEKEVNCPFCRRSK